MLSTTNATALLLGFSTAAAAGENVDRAAHFTEQGVILGSLLFLAVVFMLWVLGSFWRESRIENSSAPRRITSGSMERPRPNRPPAPHPLEPRLDPYLRPNPQPASPTLESSQS